MNKVEIKGYVKYNPIDMKKGVVRICIVAEGEALDEKNRKYTTRNTISVVTFGALGKKVLTEVKEDDDVEILGYVKTSSFESKDGSKKKYATDIEAYSVKVIPMEIPVM